MPAPAWRLDIASLDDGYARGLLDPVAVLQGLLDEVAADAGGLNAFCHLDPEGALAQAQAAAERRRRGAARSPLDGVPVSIKDLVPVAGWPTRRGSLATAHDPLAAADAPLVAHLRRAGAVLFGKTTTTEFGWCTDSHNPHAGLTRHPQDSRRGPGGSSSGAAAQVAAGWGPLAIGSDAGGSVRIPAAYCGVVGFKPSFGVIPAAPQSAFAELAHFGPLTRTVADCLLAMQVLGQPDARDGASLFPRAAADDRQALAARPLRIGWHAPDPAAPAWQAEVAAGFQALLAWLAGQGHVLVALPPLPDASLAMWTVWQSRVHESFVEWDDARRALLAPALQAVWHEGARLGMAALSQARLQLRALAGLLAQQCAEVDLLLSPATATTAPLLPDTAAPDDRPRNWFDEHRLAYPFNVSQQPALSLPLGRDALGLPFNLQVAGPRHADERVLRFGRMLEAGFHGG